VKEFRKIAKRRILKSKTESFILIGVIALVVALLFVALNLSRNYLDYFSANAELLSGQTYIDTLKSGLHNMAVIFVVLFTYLSLTIGFTLDEVYFEWMQEFTDTKMTEIVGMGDPPPTTYVPVFNNANVFFSAESMTENMPAMIIMMISVVLIISLLALSTVFSATKRERKSFFSILVASGATKIQLKACAFYESLYYCLIAIPIGLIIGTVGLYLTKLCSAIFFRNLAESYAGINYNIDIKFSFLPILIVIPLIFLMVYRYTRKVIKKISVKTIATDMKNRFVMNSGISAFSAKPVTYKRLGLQHFIATRNFSNNIGRYLRIILMTLIYTVFITATFIILSITRGYNETVFADNKLLLSLNFSLEVYFTAITVAIAIITIASVFCAVSANINANTSEYALMRSGGASMKSVLSSVRSEGLLCVFTGMLLCIVILVALIFLARLLFVKTISVNMTDPGEIIAIAVISLLVFAFSVVFSTLRTKKKMKDIDMVSVLKEAFY